MERSKVITEGSAGGDEDSEVCTNSCILVSDKEHNSNNSEKESNLCSASSLTQEEKTTIKSERKLATSPSSRVVIKGKDFSHQLKNSVGKRKVKMDWTPELHKKFVQAVEQLGLDKAVPSKILELMGTDCLTRHNVASHLQKYRSHQKHVITREVEAARWSRRQSGTGGRAVDPWVVPPMGFPPLTTVPHLRHLHVWGHPSVDQSYGHLWPKNLSTSPCLSWATGYPPLSPVPGDHSFWYCHHHDVPAPGIPCFVPSFSRTGLPTQNSLEVHHAGMYRVDPVVGFPGTLAQQTLSEPSFDFYPSKENIDAVIGDVLSKPWLPLPLGLRPPSIEFVMVELQRKGISMLPPSCA